MKKIIYDIMIVLTAMQVPMFVYSIYAYYKFYHDNVYIDISILITIIIMIGIIVNILNILFMNDK